MRITVLYGTESGNSELIAQDLAAKLQEDGHEAEVIDLQDFAPEQITPENFYLVVCSTHGEGELPNTALPFGERLDAFTGDLSGVKYAMFGLGDTFYEETYSQGSEIIDRRFAELGATRVGEYGRHDASSWDLPSDVALEWLPGVLEAAE
ncbi:nitric oxide synthase [Gulosibacter macacae]|uniref:Nitric oxide synthase n=1 Tax=Gulosibacter macacae TaxID=2488791 RepID=A0A3P3VXV3_9MICO|nr:flavodoxin domain-containing protein [Gulosibacter macacae]RRJ87625.1 nitric oxide synthase [Gulosibacter macacae]